MKQCYIWIEEYEEIVKNHSKKASKAFINSLELLKKHVKELQEELKKLKAAQDGDVECNPS